MALRLILVSLVASMGLELPSSHDLESWGRSGRVWVAARVAELSTLSTWQDLAGPGDAPEVATADEAPANRPEDPRANPVDDLSFEVVVEGMASSFAEDVATARIEAGRAEAALAAIVDGERPGGDEVIRDDDLLPPAEEAPLVAEVASTPGPSMAPPVEAPSPVVEAAPPDQGTKRLDRLANAVRLTRSAVEAWASLIDPAGSIGAGDQVVLSR